MLRRGVKKFFQKYPRTSNSIVYGTLYVGAEFSQQIFIQKTTNNADEKKSMDLSALGRYFFVGSIINSNYLYTWYVWLDKNYVGNHRKIIIKKVLLDQFVMTPPLYVIFYISMSLLEGRKDLLSECKEKFLKTYLISCLFWLPSQTLNFLFFPQAARVVYTGVCSFIWVNILCWIKRNNDS